MDEWFGTLLLLTQVNEGPGDGFQTFPRQNLPTIFGSIFVVRQWLHLYRADLAPGWN
jgi:hypothetical protein